MKKLITVLIFSILLCGCGKQDDGREKKIDEFPAKLSGTVWLFSEANDFFSYSSTMTFMDDGQMTIIRIEVRNGSENKSIIPATYRYGYPKVSMTINGHTQTGIITSDQMEIQSEIEGGGFIYTRVQGDDTSGVEK